MTTTIGDPIDRLDAVAKVTGAAKYSAEIPHDDVVHAVLVLATIAKGRIEKIDASDAQAVAGFLGILTHETMPRLNGAVTGRPGVDKKLLLLDGDRIQHDRQPIAVVIATTLERAQEAASRLHVTYEREEPIAAIDDARAHVFPPDKTPHGEPADVARGDVAAARASAEVVLDATYTTPFENHNPMEPHASIASWDGDKLTIYDATQGIFEERRKLATVFGIAESNVQVISHFLGGGFGNKGSVWPHQPLAAAAARFIGRPVKLVLGRDQMFGSTGHRPQTIQRVVLAAARDGKLAGIEHSVTATTSMFDAWMEPSGEHTTMVYDAPNVAVHHRLVRINLGTPTFMRAPGEASGTFAIESAMDELAYAVGLDPIELRLRNYAERDPQKHVPFSSKYLRECYARGAERFGWKDRDPRPRSMRDGRLLIGMGMAGAVYPANLSNASARVTLGRDGRATVRSGTQEIGQGSYTVLTQLAAEELGLPLDRVDFDLGDTAMPYAPNSGGSWTVASVGSAIAGAARKVVADLRTLGATADTPPAEYGALIERAGLLEVSATFDVASGKEHEENSCYSFGAQFAEVAVDPDFGTVRMRRMFGVFDVGRVLNAKTARSQFIGGMTMGIGMALLEETRVDRRTGRIVNANLADYVVPVCADITEIDAEPIGIRDEKVNMIGTKSVGEIGITGAAAAVANAVYHATGKRIRDLPIGASKLR